MTQHINTKTKSVIKKNSERGRIEHKKHKLENNKIAIMTHYLSIITLIVNELNSPIRKHKVP
jgi:hypothetical protein